MQSASANTQSNESRLFSNVSQLPQVPPPVYSFSGANSSTSANSNVDSRNTDKAQNNQESDFVGNSFNDKNIRRRFIRKVCLLLFVQLMFTAAVIAFFVLHSPTKRWVQSNRAIYFVSYGIFLVSYITLICCETVRRNFPTNLICLAIFTIAFSYMAAMIASYHNIQAVLIAVGVCTLVCLAVSIFSIQTKIDFTVCSGLFFCLSIVLLFFGLGVMIVFISGVDDRTKWILQMVYGSLGALIFSLFLAYDVQMLMGGRKIELSEEEYVMGALQIYLDVVQIFLFLLMLVGGGKN